MQYFTEICINLEDLLATAIDLNALLDICADIQQNRELDFPYFIEPNIREVAPKLINNSNQFFKKLFYLLKASKKFYKKS